MKVSSGAWFWLPASHRGASLHTESCERVFQIRAMASRPFPLEKPRRILRSSVHAITPVRAQDNQRVILAGWIGEDGKVRLLRQGGYAGGESLPVWVANQ
jgi:hypothetical protein